MLAGKHRPDGIHLVRHQAEFDRLVIQPGAEVEVEQVAGARQPQPVRQVARAAEHQPVLVEARPHRPATQRRKGRLVPNRRGAGAGQRLVDHRLRLGGRQEVGDDDLFAGMRSLTPTWPATNTGDEAVSVTVPVVAVGVTVRRQREAVQGLADRVLPRNAHSSSVQLVSPVRVSLRGATSGWQISSVSPLCVQAICAH